MFVESIRLINFRNYFNLEVKLNNKVNLFLGNNAQGKTNLLESIYLCSFGKSFRNNRDKDMINFDKDKCYVGAKVVGRNLDKFVEIKIEEDKPKTIRINKVELEKNRELYSGLNVVIFSPDDLRIIKDGPSERRGFLDREISQLKPVYKYNLNRYNKVLFQRNNLLKNMVRKKENEHLIEIFDFQLAKIGTDIIIERNSFVNRLSVISQDIHNKITNGNEKLFLNYTSNVDTNVASKKLIEKKFLNNLKKSRKSDILRGVTEIGPHRDDMKILIDGIDSKSFASQGQQRTAVLSIKLAEINIISEDCGDVPVLLLDDVLSELDSTRRRYLLDNFKELQIIITSTDTVQLEEFDNLDVQIYCIEDGNVYLKRS